MKTLNDIQARLAATCVAVKIAEMDRARYKGWEKTPTACYLTLADQKYRQELQDLYDVLTVRFLEVNF